MRPSTENRRQTLSAQTNGATHGRSSLPSRRTRCAR
jgi:hypothetical protein